jgi:hypothetical protein
MPVTVDRRLISQQHPATLTMADFATLWMEKCLDPQSGFPLNLKTEHPSKTRPTLIATKTLAADPGVHACSLLLCASPAILGVASADVYWLRDGALLGPTRLSGPVKNTQLLIVCPGDNLTMDLSEMAIREPGKSFPEQAVLRSLREMGSVLRPRIIKSVPYDINKHLPWLRRVEFVRELAEVFMGIFARAENSVGIPAEFVHGIEDLASRSSLTLITNR